MNTEIYKFTILVPICYNVPRRSKYTKESSLPSTNLLSIYVCTCKTNQFSILVAVCYNVPEEQRHQRSQSTFSLPPINIPGNQPVFYPRSFYDLIELKITSSRTPFLLWHKPDNKLNFVGAYSRTMEPGATPFFPSLWRIRLFRQCKETSVSCVLSVCEHLEMCLSPW